MCRRHICHTASDCMYKPFCNFSSSSCKQNFRSSFISQLQE
uniref:Uncharacterized protein n=1 Tax=Arundo donax TaxID=35708 RepID=A0A0A9BCG7_ARUDO